MPSAIALTLFGVQDTLDFRKMDGGQIPAEMRRVGSCRVQKIADYMRRRREEASSSVVPVPENLLSRPGFLTLFGHSRCEIGVKDAFSQRSHIFQTFPSGQTCRSQTDSEHILSSMYREVRTIHVDFSPSFSGHSPTFFSHLSCSLRLNETVFFLLNATVDLIQVLQVHASKQSLIVAKIAGRSLRP